MHKIFDVSFIVCNNFGSSTWWSIEMCRKEPGKSLLKEKMKKSGKSGNEIRIAWPNHLLLVTYVPVHEISNNVVCATSKASDQPAHTRSLIRAFASRLTIL